MFSLLVSLLIAQLPSLEPVADSIPLREARQSLETGDTLAAIDILDEWSMHHEVGTELNNLLGRLHFPDEPIDTASVADEPPPVKIQARKWRMRVDGGALVADPWGWDLGATLATQLAELKFAGAPAIVEAGLTSAIWSTETEPPLWALEPLLSLSVQAGIWDLRFQGWSGVFDQELDAGLLASGSFSRGDSGSVRHRWGATLRWSLISTSLAGVFGQWDDAFGDWLWDARADVRLRHDPVLATSSDKADSSIIRAARLQSLSRFVVLRRFGKWGFGPALELDLRTSLASDRWKTTGTRYQSELRKELSFSAGAVTRYVVQNGRWIELRAGWTGADMDSRIDPTFSERNTGLTTSFASGLSF